MRVIVYSSIGRHKLTATLFTQYTMFPTQESLLDDSRFIHSADRANRIVHVLDKLVELNEVEDLTNESLLL